MLTCGGHTTDFLVDEMLDPGLSFVQVAKDGLRQMIRRFEL